MGGYHFFECSEFTKVLGIANAGICDVILGGHFTGLGQLFWDETALPGSRFPRKPAFSGFCPKKSVGSRSNQNF